AARADQQHSASADPVTEAAHHDEKRCEDEGVDVDDPQLGRRRRTEVLRDAGQRERQDGVVDGDQQHRKYQHGQRHPGSPRGSAGLMAGCSLGIQADGHDVLLCEWYWGRIYLGLMAPTTWTRGVPCLAAA